MEKAVTIWDLQLEIDAGRTLYGEGFPSTYTGSGTTDYLVAYKNATRASTKRENAMRHCRAMALDAHQAGRQPYALDWIIAEIALEETSRGFDGTQQLLSLFWKKQVAVERANWGDLIHKGRSNEEVDRRLVGASLVKVLSLPGITALDDQRLSVDFKTKAVEFILSALPDLCKHIKINDSIDVHKLLYAFSMVSDSLDAALRPLDEAAVTPDIHQFCASQSALLKALNGKIVLPVVWPFLPSGFAQTRVEALFTMMRRIRDASGSQLVKILPGALDAIMAGMKELGAFGTFMARRYLHPLYRHAHDIARDYYLTSDATKPGDLEIVAADRKYPLQLTGAETKLKFLIRNVGPGSASEVEVNWTFDPAVAPEEARHSFSEIDVGSLIAEIPVKIRNSAQTLGYIANASWTNYDGRAGAKEFLGELYSQRPDIPWENLAYRDPYSVEPVKGPRPFIGRNSDLQNLYRSVVSGDMGSAYIYGQRRVGKTSLALQLSRKARESDANVEVLYLEGGDYREPTAEGTVSRLGKTLCRRLMKLNRNFERMVLPEFVDSLSPFVEFLDDVLDADPSKRYMFILDEFDELPIELFKRGPLGDAFFLTLRSISGRARIGIVLVGGENIGAIVSAQGDQLNRWIPHRLDYFDRQTHWSDYQDLIRLPVAEYIEYEHAAIERLFAWTDGNPFFTNLICQEIYQHCVSNKDGFVDLHEVDAAASIKISVSESNIFQHFWEDGILEKGQYVEDVSIRRRRILLAMATILQRGERPTFERLCKERLVDPLGQHGVDKELKHLVERKVLTCVDDNHYFCRVLLFENWLREYGFQKVLLTYTDPAEQRSIEQHEKESYVTSEELIRLAESWGIYRGRRITTEEIRAWLNQFDSNRDKRLMYQLLRGIRFYSQAAARAKMHEAMGIIRRRTVERIEDRKKFRRDILVTSLSNLDKSGTAYARIFASENRIFGENVMDYFNLKQRLASNAQSVQAVVVADDVIGSGGTARNELDKVAELLARLPAISSVKWFFVTICGFSEGIVSVQDKIDELNLPVEMHACDVLNDEDRAFSSKSSLFLNNADRGRARDIAFKIGSAIEPGNELGYQGCEALVVFEDNCPNNTVPILNKRGTLNDGTTWHPLFPRAGQVL
jgi:hypothetical protein